MRRLAILAVLLGCSSQLPEAQAPSTAPIAQAPEADLGKKPMLPATPGPGDRGVGKADQFSDYRAANPATYSITSAPKTPMRAVAQFDTHQSMMITWTGNFPDVYAAMVKAATPVTTVYVIYDGAAMKTSFQQAMSQYGASTTGLQYLNLANDSIWVRDYGPLSVRSPSGDVAFVDPRYYNERVYDDAIPSKLTSTFGINVYRQPLKWEGGNFAADGHGNCFHSQGVLLYGGTTEAKIDQYMRDYLGCETRTVIYSLQDEGTTHIDMFGKLLPNNAYLLGKYTTAQDSGNAQLLDQDAQILAGATMNDGSKLQVVRIPMPSNSNRQVWRTYTNSLFINGVNMVPVYSDDTTYQAEAMAAWQSAMPDWNHVPIDSTDLITWSGAIHCITMTVPTGKLSHFEPAPTDLCSGSDNCFPTATLGSTCPLVFEGCCGPSGVRLCGSQGVFDTGCGATGCGFTATTQAYGCGGAGAGPSDAPLVCGAACVPSCTGKTCGADGCGGSCGTCASGSSCISGVCQAPPDPCNGLTYEGCCDGTTLTWCENSQLQTQSCNNGCGWNFNQGFYDCGWSGSDPSGKFSKTCPTSCTPDCTGRTCGDDGCGGSCGVCGGGQSCTAAGTCQAACAPACAGRQCGTDGCGGACGTCSAGTACNATGQCVAACVPACTGKVCGTDGCGGTCGVCGAGKACNGAGQCAPAGCGSVPATGQCTGSVLSWCQANVLQTKDCKTLGNLECKQVVGSSPPSFNCAAVAGCVPSCAGNACGPDGCGGLCGTCATGELCTSGQCVSADPCGGLTFTGCCNSAVLQWCEAGQIKSQSCGTTGCGWNATASYYDCGYSGDGPATSPKACGAAGCVPSCTGKVCGDDGCGGTCGVCTGGTVCQAGACVSGCGDVSFEGACSGTQLLYCENGVVQSGDCVATGAAACCGFDASSGYYDCLAANLCGGCIPECTEGEGDCSIEGTHAWTCDVSSGCPKRAYSWCPLGCDTNTGACKPQSGCTPSCAGKACGSDGCGGSCGNCASGESCNAAGLCVAGCSPSCTGQECGSDGCGGQCGSCLAANACISGQCVPSNCNPQCSGKVCGDDGCGGVCGTCTTGMQCDANGLCAPAQTCVADCADKPCGPDGCGGTCGVCGARDLCQDWQCVPSPTIGCAEVPPYGMCEGNTLRYCGTDNKISEVNCESQKLTCVASASKADCVEPGACLADCTGKLCGDDGCGGSCGTCAGGDTCDAGKCVGTVCKDGTPAQAGTCPGDGTDGTAGADSGSSLVPSSKGGNSGSCSAGGRSSAGPLGLLLGALALLLARRRTRRPLG